MSYSIEKIDHPVDAEPVAEEFWIGLLGFENVPKPPENAARGGRWFGRQAFQVHVTPSPDFQPATGTHVAFRVSDIDALRERLVGADFAFIPNGGPLEAPTSFFIADPFANRLESVAA